MKFALIFLFLIYSHINIAQVLGDSILISDYMSDCIEVWEENYMVDIDSADFIFKNGKNDLRVANYYTTAPDKNTIIEKLFYFNKITISSIYKIITDGYTPKENNPLYLYGIEDLSNLLTENTNGKYRIIELLIGVGSDNPLGIHLLLYNDNAIPSDNLIDFIKNSKVICLKYNHMLI